MRGACTVGPAATEVSTRLVIHHTAALRLIEAGADPSPEHGLLAPTLLRSQVLSALHEAVASRKLTEDEGIARRSRLNQLRVRYLGDAVLRRRAWEVADRLGWAATYDAEYIALTQLQGDALVVDDAELARVAATETAIEPFEILTA